MHLKVPSSTSFDTDTYHRTEMTEYMCIKGRSVSSENYWYLINHSAKGKGGPQDSTPPPSLSAIASEDVGMKAGKCRSSPSNPVDDVTHVDHPCPSTLQINTSKACSMSDIPRDPPRGDARQNASIVVPVEQRSQVHPAPEDTIELSGGGRSSLYQKW